MFTSTKHGQNIARYGESSRKLHGISAYIWITVSLFAHFIGGRERDFQLNWNGSIDRARACATNKCKSGGKFRPWNVSRFTHAHMLNQPETRDPKWSGQFRKPIHGHNLMSLSCARDIPNEVVRFYIESADFSRVCRKSYRSTVFCI